MSSEIASLAAPGTTVGFVGAMDSQFSKTVSKKWVLIIVALCEGQGAATGGTCCLAGEMLLNTAATELMVTGGQCGNKEWAVADGTA